jgi:hypothetical protein
MELRVFRWRFVLKCDVSWASEFDKGVGRYAFWFAFGVAMIS